jgi:hypothetical protein
MKKLPKTLFVTLESPGTDDEYLNAQAEKGDLVEMHQTKEIGEYVLKRRVEVKGVAEELREVG